MRKLDRLSIAALFLVLAALACSKPTANDNRQEPSTAQLAQNPPAIAPPTAPADLPIKKAPVVPPGSPKTAKPVEIPTAAPTVAEVPVKTPSELPQIVTSAESPTIPEPPPAETAQPVDQQVSPTPETPAVVAPPATRRVTIPAGTAVAIRTIESIDSRTDQPGQTYRASIDTAIAIANQVVIPRGADARLTLKRVLSAGDFRGKSELQVELDRIVVDKKEYVVASNVIERTGEAEGPKTAAELAVGAAIGAAIGGIAGGSTGAAIGAGVGAGSGAIIAAITRGEQVIIPSEARLDFRLQQPLEVEVAGTQQAPLMARDQTSTSGPRRIGEGPPDLPDRNDREAIDLSGEWSLTIGSLQNRRTLKLFLYQDDERLTGRIIDPIHGAVRLYGRVDERSVRFTTQTDPYGPTGRSEYTGTLIGGRLRGTVVNRTTQSPGVPRRGERGRVPAPDRSMNWSAERVDR